MPIKLDTRASFIKACQINDIDPLAYLTDVLTTIVNGHPHRDVDRPLPWAYRTQALKARGPEGDAYNQPQVRERPSGVDVELKSGNDSTGTLQIPSAAAIRSHPQGV